MECEPKKLALLLSSVCGSLIWRRYIWHGSCQNSQKRIASPRSKCHLLKGGLVEMVIPSKSELLRQISLCETTSWRSPLWMSLAGFWLVQSTRGLLTGVRIRALKTRALTVHEVFGKNSRWNTL